MNALPKNKLFSQFQFYLFLAQKNSLLKKQITVLVGGKII